MPNPQEAYLVKLANVRVGMTKMQAGGFFMKGVFCKEAYVLENKKKRAPHRSKR
jgi:hypothetical protein